MKPSRNIMQWFHVGVPRMRGDEPDKQAPDACP